MFIVGPRTSRPESGRDARVQLSDHLWLNQEQIGVLGLFAGGGDQRMRLAAVMRLVIEEMRDEQPVRRAHLAFIRGRRVLRNMK